MSRCPPIVRSAGGAGQSPLGAQLVDVLPEREFTEEHLPHAINIPLKQLDAKTTATLDRSRAVVVYCWDGL
jgi:rhodanese-related sulfurtransferase